jgi:hypothetical protein
MNRYKTPTALRCALEDRLMAAVMCAKNFSTPAKFGIMPEVPEISSGLLRAERRARILYDQTKNESYGFGGNL